MSQSMLNTWLDSQNYGPAIRVTSLPSSLLKFPPSPLPATLPPPSEHQAFAHPFPIPSGIYNAALSANVPITIALVYASLVTYLNSLNASRKYKAWAFSRTRLFKGFVIAHNIILAIYSAWTCLGMINALRLSFPGWRGQDGVAGAVDSLCKIHGPRGLGNSATYNASSSLWTMTNKAFHLAADGLGPESTDIGRIWNEGLAFYGWFFYLSKFYEIIDTFIILAKGKKSTFLQTYHHAGAMMAMWAGIRYMSPPIWMFVLVNSGIHSIMYTFYLCSAIGISVPKWFKQSLTTLQIAQFVVGASYAFLHLFISYQVPLKVAYLYHPGGIMSAIPSSIPSQAASTVSSAIETATAGIGAMLKKAALLAAGRKGLAENVVNEQGNVFGAEAVHAAQDFVAREVTNYRDELQYVHCLDTSGQVFAILLNCMYLAPLTWLFARFFVTAYLKRAERRRSSTASEKAALARQSFRDATKGVTRQVTGIVEEMQGTSEEIGAETEVATGEEIKQELRGAAANTRDDIRDSAKKVQEIGSGADTGQIKQNVKSSLDAIAQATKDQVNRMGLTTQDGKGGVVSTDSTAEESKDHSKQGEAPGDKEVAAPSSIAKKEAHEIPVEGTIDESAVDSKDKDAQIEEHVAPPAGGNTQAVSSEGVDESRRDDTEDAPPKPVADDESSGHLATESQDLSERQHAEVGDGKEESSVNANAGEEIREPESQTAEDGIGEDESEKAKPDVGVGEPTASSPRKPEETSADDTPKTNIESRAEGSEVPVPDHDRKSPENVDEGEDSLEEEAQQTSRHETNPGYQPEQHRDAREPSDASAKKSSPVFEGEQAHSVDEAGETGHDVTETDNEGPKREPSNGATATDNVTEDKPTETSTEPEQALDRRQDVPSVTEQSAGQSGELNHKSNQDDTQSKASEEDKKDDRMQPESQHIQSEQPEEEKQPEEEEQPEEETKEIPTEDQEMTEQTGKETEKEHAGANQPLEQKEGDEVSSKSEQTPETEQPIEPENSHQQKSEAEKHAENDQPASEAGNISENQGGANVSQVQHGEAKEGEVTEPAKSISASEHATQPKPVEEDEEPALDTDKNSAQPESPSLSSKITETEAPSQPADVDVKA